MTSWLTLAVALAATACGTPPSSLRHTSTPEAEPTGTALATALPTPTPVPLPGICLQEQFAHDVADCGAIPVYEISLSVDPGTARVTGHQEIRYTNLEDEPLSDLYLRLFPGTPGYGGAMTVTNLLANGRVSTPEVELGGTALHLQLFPSLAVGGTVNLSMDFEADVPTTGMAGHALFSYLRGVMALPTVYPIIPVYDDEGWNVEIAPEYGDDIYSDIAIYDVQVTAPSAMKLATSGSCAVQSQGAVTTTWACDAGPMRNFVLILGEDYEIANRVVDGVVVNSYYYARHEQGGGRALEVAAAALSVFGELFGPYPYSELDIVETPNHLNGMEYPGLVVIADRLYGGVTGVEWLAAHEVAHQWWFGVVGSDQIDEPWLDEALTQYSTVLYYEAVYGPESAAAILENVFSRTYEMLVSLGRDLPAGLPASAYGPELYWDIVYDKGALYFDELRQALGDEIFYEVLRQHFLRHRYGIATPESFLDVVEDVAGDRHQEIYERWIGGS